MAQQVRCAKAKIYNATLWTTIIIMMTIVH